VAYGVLDAQAFENHAELPRVRALKNAAQGRIEHCGDLDTPALDGEDAAVGKCRATSSVDAVAIVNEELARPHEAQQVTAAPWTPKQEAPCLGQIVVVCSIADREEAIAKCVAAANREWR
jgi:hypothetical protein